MTYVTPFRGFSAMDGKIVISGQWSVVSKAKTKTKTKTKTKAKKSLTESQRKKRGNREQTERVGATGLSWMQSNVSCRGGNLPPVSGTRKKRVITCCQHGFVGAAAVALISDDTQIWAGASPASTVLWGDCPGFIKTGWLSRYRSGKPLNRMVDCRLETGRTHRSAPTRH